MDLQSDQDFNRLKRCITEAVEQALCSSARPSILYRPVLWYGWVQEFSDMRWVVEYDSPNGEARAYGNTPAEAMAAFDAAWTSEFFKGPS